MIHRARTLVTVLALGVATPSGLAFADKADDAFYNQTKYTYCDAKMLSGLWQQSMADTKTRIGQKLVAGRQALKYLDGELGHARDHARKDAASRCDYNDIGLSYDDIDRVAKAWKDTPADVKQLVEGKILSGMETEARDLVHAAEKQGAASQGGQDANLEAFWDQQRFQYCDAKLIAGLWKKDIVDGKAWIGAKLLAKQPQLVERKLVAARAAAAKHAENRCTFDEVGFEYDDAAKLAKLWNVDVGKSKAMIAQKVTDGRRDELRAQLKRAK